MGQNQYCIVGLAFPEGALLKTNTSHSNAIFKVEKIRPFS